MPRRIKAVAKRQVGLVTRTLPRSVFAVSFSLFTFAQFSSVKYREMCFRHLLNTTWCRLQRCIAALRACSVVDRFPRKAQGRVYGSHTLMWQLRRPDKKESAKEERRNDPLVSVKLRGVSLCKLARCSLGASNIRQLASWAPRNDVDKRSHRRVIPSRRRLLPCVTEA